MGLSASQITGVGIPIADTIVNASALIIGQINRNEDNLQDASRRGSLVASYCEQMYHQFSAANPSIRACIVTVSTLPKETSNLSWVGNEQISEWGYSVEVGFQGGWIRNNGNRGFENWCVCGANHQDDNIIYID